MRSISLSHFLFLAVFISCESALAKQPICHDYTSEIEPEMQRHESDFTAESYRNAQKTLEEVVPKWMEAAFEHNKKFPNTYNQLFQGDIWLAHANSNAMVKGYVLKLEYLSASLEKKEETRKAFCKFIAETPYFD